MRIDLSQPGALTLASVAALIASKDDSQARQIRVSVGGEAYLSDDVGHKNLTNVLFRLETLDAGNGYVGLQASKDQEWVGRIFAALDRHWPTPASSYIDFF